MIRIESEADLVADAAAELVRILEALPRHHGEAFRDLQRRIEALADLNPDPVIHEIRSEGEKTILVIAPPPVFVALIEEAKRLGV